MATGSFSLSVLLGVTWIFGFLMLIPQSTFSNTAAYIFTIFNASQVRTMAVEEIFEITIR